MGTLTNVHGLPQAIMDAVTADPYTGGTGDISCTKLIEAPQIRVLGGKHTNEITVDVSDRVFSLMGQALHTVLERAGLKEEGVVIEERLYAEVNGWAVSGQVDRIHIADGTLSDFKMTTVWKQHGSDSWTRQLNVLRWLAHQNGHQQITRLEVVAVFRDWRKTEAKRNPSYPQAAIMTIPVPVWPLDEAEEYIRERVYIHQAASRGEEVPCTDEERWFSGNTYALMKTGGKRALKVSADRSALPELTEGQYIDVRVGEYKRCQHYCDVSQFCEQWAKTKRTGGVNDDDA
jgi:hypothetical protein